MIEPRAVSVGRGGDHAVRRMIGRPVRRLTDSCHCAPRAATGRFAA